MSMNAASNSWRDRLPDGSKSVQSVWVWRGMFFFSLIALGVVLIFLGNGLYLYATLWGVIALGWFTISMWLWRKHVKDDDAAHAAQQRGGKK